MSWRHWFGASRASLPDDAAKRVARWRALSAADATQAIDRCRFVIVDTETTGLDPDRAELVAIGACVVQDLELRVDESFQIDLRPNKLSVPENVLVHEIGYQRQSAAASPESALSEFLDFTGKSILVAHHALFDAQVIRRALRQHLHLAFDAIWLDVGVLLPALAGEEIQGPIELDHLVQRYGAAGFSRHDALSDAYATAQLLLVALQQARRRNTRSVAELMRIEKQALSRAVQESARLTGL